MSLPALEAIRRATPAARLDLALPGHLAELFSSVPGVDGTLPLQRGAAALPALARQWSAGRFDSVLLLPNSFGSALAARLAGIPRRAGYATQGRSWLLTEAIPCGGRQRGLHQAEYYAELVADLGAPPSGLDLKRPVHLPVPEAARRRVEDLLAAERRRPQAPLYVLAPCAAGPGKEWPADRFARLAHRLWAGGGEVVLTGAPSESPAIAAIAASARATGAEVIDVSGRNSVAEMAALFLSAAGFAGNDSGPMHLAGAMGLAAVGIFVRTPPLLYRPLGPRTAVLGGPGACPEAEEVADRLTTLAAGGDGHASA